ncbi:MAG: tetratricopeptide repeat protein [Bacteriovorax sp.]|jgi:tetratricopeptide (TPR) repeat protein|nr:tetratricopeptide repeat protein [Bacteriovorax sp.]
MGVKYRVRLKNDRVIGPFSSEEIKELFLKEHIVGDEFCQQFPIGDWKSLQSFSELQPFLQNSTKNESPGAKKAENQSFQEFKFDKKVDIEVDYVELEKKYQAENLKSVNPPDEDQIEKTKIIKKPANKSHPDVDRTIVVPSKASRPKIESEETRLRIVSEKKKLNEPPPVPTQEELVNEKTEFINLASVLPSINAQLSVSEVELEQKARIEENQEKVHLKELREKRLKEETFDRDERENTSDENDEKNGKKKGMSWIVAFAFLGIFYVLLTPDELPKTQGLKYLDIKFPMTQEYEDKAAAGAALSRGRDLYAKNNYLNRIQASDQFLLSLQKQFSNNEALGELILTYSELLEETKDSKISANTIYKLIQLSENKMLTDLNVVTGTALFYGKIGKYQTGINVIKNYLRVKGPISSKLLAYDLELLINAGDLVEARKIYTKLKEIPKKPQEAYYYLARFSEIDDQQAEAQNTIEEGLKYYPNSALLLLKYADYLFKSQSQKKYEEVLNKCNQIKSEGSPSFTAKFYQHMGLMNALKKKNKEASSYFKKSLDLKESDELRTMLSSLEISGDNMAQSLILESKVIDLIKKANTEIKNKNIEAAFTFSIEAIDAFPDYIPAILQHVDLQLRRGLFDSAIISLKKAIDANPTNLLLKKNLVQAYFKSYKLPDAQKLLIELSQTKFSLTSEYASLMGHINLLNSNIPLSAKWFGEALNRDPLSDADMFQLAKIFIRIKKFNDAKMRLNKALILDPKNTEYLAAYSEVLFEQDNTDTAVGYLRDAISEIGEDPKLIAAIAKIYYKSGQIKEFENYYKRIQELPKKDESFYEFLVYAAKLEEKNDDYINYSYELLRFNPGNLKARLELGEFLFNLKRYQEAIREFEEVRQKLSSYPKVHFMLSKVYLAIGDIKKAKEMALKEVELNPTLDSAYFICGEVARVEKDYREAIQRFEKAISLNPKSVEALMGLGWIKLSQNYASEAIELYNQALKEDKNNPEIYKQMGFAHKAAGQRALAKEKFEDYMKLSPAASDHDQIEAQIKNLQ